MILLKFTRNEFLILAQRCSVISIPISKPINRHGSKVFRSKLGEMNSNFLLFVEIFCLPYRQGVHSRLLFYLLRHLASYSTPTPSHSPHSPVVSLSSSSLTAATLQHRNLVILNHPYCSPLPPFYKMVYQTWCLCDTSSYWVHFERDTWVYKGSLIQIWNINVGERANINSQFPER